MKIYTGSLASKLLEYLYTTPEVARKRLYIPFAAEYEYTSYSKVVKRLLEEEYVELFRKDELNYIRLTVKGKKAIEEKDKEKAKALKSEKPNTSTRQRANRARQVANVIALCTANGIALNGAEKPKLGQLLKPPDTMGTQTLQELAAKGIFYSVSEIRAAIQEVYGKNDALKLSRLVGIILYGKNLTFVYSIGQSVIKWNATNEMKMVELIRRYFSLSTILKGTVDPQKKSICLICGESYSAVPKIVSGSSWGTWNDDSRTSPKEYFRKRAAGEWLTAKNLAKVFSRAYFVCSGVQDIPYFLSAVMMDEQTTMVVATDWWNNNISNATHITTMGYFQGLTTNGKGEIVALSILVDIIELSYYRARNKPMHIIISQRGAKDAIAKILGPNLLSIRTTMGEKLSTNQYDENGLLIKTANGHLKPTRTTHKNIRQKNKGKN